MIIEYSNFIAGGFIDKSICNNLINYFEDCKYKVPGKVGNSNESAMIKDDIKKSTDLNIMTYNQDKQILDYYDELNKITKMYKDKYKYCDINMERWAITEAWNIQRYKPNEGFFKYHCEVTGKDLSERHLVFMTYLNDVNDGGETEWYYQQLKIKPQKGLTILWPPNWSYTHRGISSKTETKYICTGWYSFY